MRPLREAVHLNLVDSSRQLFELDPGARVERGEGWLLGAGRAENPAISNAAFRTDDAMAPEELLRRASDFFAGVGHGYSVWVRGEDGDRDLTEACEAAGLRLVFEMPEMVLRSRVPEGAPPEGVEIRRLRTEAEAEDYWRVAAAAYASIGFPPEVFAFYEDHRGLLADNAASFLAYLDGSAVAIATTIASHGVAGIYWVGSLEAARGKGLGRAMTAKAINAGFDLGAEVASLQASPMGEPLYRSMGFETLFDYRLFMAAA